jgi:hypothetical protein
MLTSTGLKENVKPIIGKIYRGKILSVNIPLTLSKLTHLKNGDYVFSWIDSKNCLVFERANTGLDKEDSENISSQVRILIKNYSIISIKWSKKGSTQSYQKCTLKLSITFCQTLR